MAGESASVTSRVTSSNAQSSRAGTGGSRLSAKQDDENPRRNPPQQKAWGSGVNPITQRSNTPSQPNGSVNRSTSKPASLDATNPGNMDKTQDRHFQVLTHAMGFFCTFTTKDGGSYVGIPTGTKGKGSDTHVLLTQVRTSVSDDFDKPQKHVAKPQWAGEGAQHNMTIPAASLAFFLCSDAVGSVRNAQGKGFMTDTEISGNAPLRERKLERWQAPTDDSATFTGTTHSGDWDQFKVNEQKFGVKSTYNEDVYTTHLDRNSAKYAETEAKAARLAAEIEGNVKSNAWSEQRGSNDEGYDEEDLYSGVRRDATPLQSGQPNRYVPPSRRSQQGIPSEVDPAILSAQVAQKSPVPTAKQSQSAESAVTQKPAQTPDTSATTSKTVPADASASKSSKAAAPAPIQTQASAASQAPANVAAAFKQFANLEKLKVQNNRHIKNQQDKAVKVNDLKKFAKNFKLHTPVPKDLLPILAKDEAKQNEIVKKAQEQAEQNKKTPEPKPQAATNAASTAKRQSESAASGAQTSKAQGQVSAGAPTPPHTLSQRLEGNRNQHKMRNVNGGPANLPIHEGRQVRQSSYNVSNVTSPTKPAIPRGPPSATALKFNPQVTEFKPSAMAPAFKPGSAVSGTTNVSSPSSHPVTRTITPVSGNPSQHVVLFREAKARNAKGVARKPITWQLDHIKSIKPRDDEHKTDSTGSADAASKDSLVPTIQQPFKQKVDWISASLDESQVESLPKYKELFARDRMSRQPSYAASPSNTPRGPHHHQYPQNGTPNMHMPISGQMPPHMQGQPPQHFAQGGHFDDQQMRPSPSMQSAYPGPQRMPGGYSSPVPHVAQMAHQGPYMAPPHGMPPRQYSNSGPGGVPGQYMQPPMPMHQGPGGPYMQQQMMPMQPHPQYQMQQQGYPMPPHANGYPSPGRGAPPMMHSGSHQGHPQPYTPNGQYAQPYQQSPGHMVQRGSFNGHPGFPQSPYQQHPYPARTPSHGYAQPHQQAAMMTPQAPPAQPAMNGNDEAK